MSLNKPESIALIAQENHVKAYFGTRYKLDRTVHEPHYNSRPIIDRLKILQEENPDSQIVFANPFESIYEKFPTINNREDVPLLAFVSKNQKLLQLTNKQVQNALLESKKRTEADSPLTAIEALEHLHQQCGIIRMTRKQAQQLLPDFIEPDVSPIEPDQNDLTFKKRIIQAQRAIKNGDISQAVLSRTMQGEFMNYSPVVAQQIFNNLLNQYGEYMAFMLLDNVSGHALIGASPEQHLKVTKKQKYNEVRHSALAGTLPKKGLGATNYSSAVQQFLDDPKEMKELSQVADEDAKNIFPLCDHGHIEGPHLYETSSVFHTGYDIIGHDTDKKHPLDYLKEVPAVATLVGSPMESALDIQEQTDEPSRGYYGGSVGVLKPNREMDSTVTIRTTEIYPNGTLAVQAGAGIVLDSDPQKECDETRAKALGAIQSCTTKTLSQKPFMQHQNEFKYERSIRKPTLNTFLQNIQPNESKESLSGQRIVIVNNKDNFAHTQAMMIRHMGAEVSTIDMEELCRGMYIDINPIKRKHLQRADMVILGPGPGNISHIPDPYFNSDITTRNAYAMEQVRRLLKVLLEDSIPTLGICLGHQALCQANGMTLSKNNTPQQGLQQEEMLFGEKEKIGFYNSFSAEIPKQQSPNITHTPDSEGRSLMIEGPSFVGAQFHPESLFTKNGYEILEKLVLQTLSKKTLA